jgi:diguanylate cyclase (GGDEF)-like protein/PAS domain S-box-containing protein
MSLLEKPEVFRFVLESLQAGVYLVDRSRRVLCWNDGAERISGYLRQEVVGRNCDRSLLLHCDEQGMQLCGSCPLARTMQDGKKREVSVYLRHKAGHLVPVHVWCVPIRDEHGNIIGASESFEERKPSAGLDVRYQDLAAHGCLDPVTGLPNEAFTRTRLREQMGRFSEHHLPFSILIIGLANNKVFTAGHGHPAAERMLQSAAQTLSNVLRPTDFLGRWEGDQLLAILLGHRAQGSGAQPIGKLVGLSQIHWWGDSVPVSVDVAGAEPEAGEALDALLARAQSMLKTAARAARSGAASASPAQPED